MFNLFIEVIAPSVVALPLGIGLAKTRQWGSCEKIIFGYLLFSGVFNCIATITAELYLNNLPILHLYTILEFGIVCLFFIKLFDNKKRTLIIAALGVSFSLFSLSYVLYTNSLFIYNDLSRFISSMLITLLCLFFLFDHIARPGKEVSVFSFGSISVFALLLYFSCCSTLFGLSNYLEEGHNAAIKRTMWNLHSFFMIAMYLCIAWAYLSIRKSE